ncbi:Multiple epidermal growth factor-like domains protein 10, partial [Stegodyphus mimosarum]
MYASFHSLQCQIHVFKSLYTLSFLYFISYLEKFYINCQVIFLTIFNRMHSTLHLAFAFILYWVSSMMVAALSGPNVCTKHQMHKESYRMSYVKTQLTRYLTWCFAIPPRCTKYRVSSYTAYRTDYRTKLKSYGVCCSGYVENHGTCIPKCTDDCRNGGTCTGPEKCSCTAGWTGLTCETECPTGSYGLNCAIACDCRNDAVCDRFSGECYCKPGWKGIYCDVPCEKGSYGSYCFKKCYCVNGGECSPLDGSCKCLAGYQGDKCQDECPPGSWGLNCSQR